MNTKQPNTTTKMADQAANSQATSQTTPKIDAATTLPSEAHVPVETKPAPEPTQKKSPFRKILSVFQPKIKDPKPEEVKKEEDALNQIVVEESAKTMGNNDVLGVSTKDTLGQQTQNVTRN